MSKDIVAATRSGGLQTAECNDGGWKTAAPCAWRRQLINHHDRANRNLGEELFGGVARKANAAV